MQRLEVSCAVRRIYIYIYTSLGAKGLTFVNDMEAAAGPSAYVVSKR